jgi:hypothetical protein
MRLSKRRKSKRRRRGAGRSLGTASSPRCGARPRSPAQPHPRCPSGQRSPGATDTREAQPGSSDLNPLPSPKRGEQDWGSREDCIGVETQDRPRSFCLFSKRVLPSLPHSRECRTFIKVIFQEIASRSQVTAQSAPECQALPPHPSLVPLRSERGSSHFVTVKSWTSFTPPGKEKPERKVGDCARSGPQLRPEP